MKLTNISRDTLLRPLQAVSGVVERRHTLPILSNVLLEFDADTLSVVATDLELQVTAQTACDGGAAKAAVTVSARKLQDILRALPEQSAVALDVDDRRLQVKAGRSRFNLQTLPAEEFPRLAASAGGETSISLAQRDLKRLLSLVQYAMAQQDIRYYLNGLLLALGDGHLVAVATDGHRLAFARQNAATSAPRSEVILPRKAVLELFKLLEDSDAAVRVDVLQNQVRFGLPDITLITKVVDGKFPDYTKVIPTGYRRHFEIDRLVLLQALQRAAILSNEKFRGVRWVLTHGSLKIVSSNAEQEEAEEELEIGYDGEPLDVGFNVGYLQDVLNNISASSVDCAFGDANSSMLLTVPGEAEFKYVVMPMRI